ANGALEDSTIDGGRIPQLTFDAGVAQDALHVKANGSFADVDAARATGKPSLTGAVAGTLDVDATVQHLSAGVDVKDIDGAARLSLDRTTLGGLAIEGGAVDADVHGGL